MTEALMISLVSLLLTASGVLLYFILDLLINHPLTSYSGYTVAPSYTPSTSGGYVSPYSQSNRNYTTTGVMPSDVY